MADSPLNDFYLLLDTLAGRLGGHRQLGEIRRDQGWPTRGVYFFFEPGEIGPTRQNQERVVRVGTHGLRTGSKSTLYGRLSQHRGIRSGGGNHRGSVFRKHVGTALLNRNGTAHFCPSWGIGSNAQASVKKTEHWLECEVSDYLGSMRLLWVEIDDEPGPDSERGFIERNAIALLAGREAASRDWLGRYTHHPMITGSNLWNVNHVQDSPASDFLDRFEQLVDLTVRQKS